MLPSIKFSHLLRPLLPLAIFIAFISGAGSHVQAVLNTDVPTNYDDSCDKVAQFVYSSIENTPAEAQDIIALAVKNHPECANTIIKKGFDALAAAYGTVDDKLVKSILTTVLNYIKGDPELMETVIKTVEDEFPGIKIDIPNILAGIYVDPLKRGENSSVYPGLTGTPTPTPSPTAAAPSTPIPVTPDTTL